MKIDGNTILVTGGGSGIGRGLATAFLALGNTVVIAGRREAQLRAVAEACPGLDYLVFDQADGASIPGFVRDLIGRHPALNVIVNNAGIQREEILLRGDLAAAEETIATNLLGPLRLTAALLPSLLDKPRSAILNVSSALAFVPQALTPTYCATKAAMHSYTQSLRYQLQGTSVAVIEIIPPWVQTELQGERGLDPRAMPLADYLAETMRILRDTPDVEEVVVDRAKPMRLAAASGTYDQLFAGLNGSRPAPWRDASS